MKFNKINKNLLSAGIFAAALFLAGCTSEQKTTPSEDFAFKNISKITVIPGILTFPPQMTAKFI